MPNPGKITASGFSKVMTKGRSKADQFGETARTYASEIVMELLGVVKEEVYSPSLEWGKTYEWLAITHYMERELVEVEQFTESQIHPTLPYIAGTPDGRIKGQNGGIEVKCPYNPVNHLKNLLNNEQLSDYGWQIQGYMWIMGWDFIDFISFDPRFPEPQQLHVHRVHRDEEQIKQLEERCILFWNELVDPVYHFLKPMKAA